MIVHHLEFVLLKYPRYKIGIGNVAFDEVCTGRQILPPACGEIVQNHNLVPQFQKFLHYMGALDIGDLNFGKVGIKFIFLSRTALPIGEALFRRKTVGGILSRSKNQISTAAPETSQGP